MIQFCIEYAVDNPFQLLLTIVSILGAISSWGYAKRSQRRSEEWTDSAAINLTATELDKVLWAITDVYREGEESNYEWQRFVEERMESRGMNVLRTYSGSGVEAVICRYGSVMIVAIRGTDGTWDVIRDLSSGKVNAPFQGRAHRNFQQDAELLYWDMGLRRDVRRLRKPNDRLVICGHSLGGATAIQLSAILSQYHQLLPEDEVVTLCAPRSADPEHARAIERRIGSQIHRFVNSRDLVPMLPPAWLGFRHVSPTRYFDSKGEYHSALTLGFKLYDFLASNFRDAYRLRWFRGLLGYHSALTVADLVRLAIRHNRIELLPEIE